MHGVFSWNELASADVERAKSFYGATLDWTFEEFELPGSQYWVLRDPTGAAIGWMTSARPA